MDENKYEVLSRMVDELEETIEKTHLTNADSNVLSAALQKIKTDRNKLQNTIRSFENNKYDDMIDYYTGKINVLYRKLSENYRIVLNLYNIARDKERESLLKYLEGR